VPVHVIEKNLLPAVAPAHDMIGGPGVLEAQLARHSGILQPE
jgi:hypothetical protein